MANREELRVIVYDIADDRRRRKVAAILEDEAVRVQESAFEARLDMNEAEDLLGRLKGECGNGDSIRIYTVPDQALKKCRVHGGAPAEGGGRYWIV